jgi:hypothetical protein
LISSLQFAQKIGAVVLEANRKRVFYFSSLEKISILGVCEVDWV